MNSKIQKAYAKYLMSDKYDLHDAYGRFSNKKYEAWKYCQKLCEEHDGRGLKVIGANSSFFSAGFMYEEDGKENFMYITHGGDYSAEVV